MTDNRHIMLAAGGTGGHIFPAIAVAEALLARGYTVSLITDARGMDLGSVLPEVTVHRISASGIGGGVVAKVKAVLSIGIGVVQARRLFRKFRPRCIVGFGGYPSVPTMLAATLYGLPTVIHEQNAVLGRANHLVAGRVSAIATSFEETEGVSTENAAKITVTGNPVRHAFTGIRSRPYPPIGPNGEGVKILVLGGSLGATIFSDVVPRAIADMPDALRRRFAIVQQCRAEDIDRVRDIYESVGMSPELATFFDDIPERMASAHIVITRAGASTIAELAEAGRPAILVPYPHALDDHQTANARSIDDRQAGWLMPQDGFTPESLTIRLEGFVNLPNTLINAAEAAKSLGGRNAADVVADQVERLSGARPNGGAGPATDPVREIAA
ncbi:MAG: undecaprenyldiphospho-muramoylpentapeptide beta-N-acetylglucosaminyltransferase [Alphaproteobacteria bacterium]